MRNKGVKGVIRVESSYKDFMQANKLSSALLIDYVKMIVRGDLPGLTELFEGKPENGKPNLTSKQKLALLEFQFNLADFIDGAARCMTTAFKLTERFDSAKKTGPYLSEQKTRLKNLEVHKISVFSHSHEKNNHEKSDEPKQAIKNTSRYTK